MKFNTPDAKALYAELMCWLDPQSKGCHDGLTDLFIDHFNNHLVKSGLTLKLKQLGIPEHMLMIMAEDAMKQGRLLQNNPRELTLEDAYNIYQSIY